MRGNLKAHLAPLVLAVIGLGVPLQLCAQSYYGNRFEVLSAVSMGYIDAINKKASLRFTAQTSKSVTSFRVYISNNQSGSKAYRYGIQRDNAGIPDGTWLGYRDLTISGGSTGWQTVALASNINVTAGTVYHIVVQPVDNPSNSLSLRATQPCNRMIPYDQASDPNSNTLFYDGTGWTVQGYQPVYFLVYSDNTYEGNPCSLPAYGSIYGSTCESERLTISGGDKAIAQVDVYLKKEGNPPNNCNFVLYNVTDAVEVASGTIATPSQVTTSYAWCTYSLSTCKTLVEGKQYRLYLKTTGGTSSNRYIWHMPFNTSAADLNSRNYDGTNSLNQTSTDGGLSWTQDWPNYDATFRFALLVLSVNVDPSAVALGTVLPAVSDIVSQTARPNGEVLVTNTGNVSVKYELRITNPPEWTSTSTAPANPEEYRLSSLFHPDQAVASDFDKAAPSYSDVLGITGKTCDGFWFATGTNQDGYDVPPGATQNLYFDFDAPQSTTVTSQQSIVVTVTAAPM